jgi:large subunit ribosomal protein L10
MPITKEKKKEIVSGLKKSIQGSKSVVFVNFHGLSVLDSRNLRKALREENVGYTVARKTLINLTLDAEEIAGSKPELNGELALAYGDDLLSPARGIYEFQKKLVGKVSIMGGIFDGRYMSSPEMLEIASIPPIETLRGMFVNIVNSPIQRFVIALSEVAKTKN